MRERWKEYQGFWRRGVDWIWWRSYGACDMWDAEPSLRSSELSLSLSLLGFLGDWRGGLGTECEREGDRYIEGFDCFNDLDRTAVIRSWLLCLILTLFNFWTVWIWTPWMRMALNFDKCYETVVVLNCYIIVVYIPLFLANLDPAY